ncbi:hypothetical protein M6B38_270720 [Iris pallida]|uniref:Uncharacterized protein n=1 Tax=Iris pallida TaxID=29817 RepID=A0AAX6I863_IRIPA|nr:hypothetical protein M6B38_270720 [Iris pallida]
MRDDVKSEFRTQDYVWLYEFDARVVWSNGLEILPVHGWVLNSIQQVIFVGVPGPFGLGEMNNHCWCTSFGYDLRSAIDVISHN